MKSIRKLIPSRYKILPLLAASTLYFCGSAGAADYPTTVLADHPVAYYRLEESAGASVATDSSGNGLDATYIPNVEGTTPTLGLAGIATNSISFSGGPNNDYGFIDIPFNSLLAPTKADGVSGAAFSIECWVQAVSPNNGGAYLSIVGMFGVFGSGPYSGASGWLIGQTPGPGSSWLFNMRNAGFLSPTAVVPLQWTHLVGTFDGTNQTFYVNGVQVATASSTTYLADNGSDGQIGGVQNAGFPPYGPWNGGVDEVAFYTNALTAGQVSTHYQIGTNSFRIAVTPPGILNAPVAETNYSGTPVTFSIIANGTGPLFYQWSRLGSGTISGATNADYTFVSHYPADDGAQFSVTVSSAAGSTNSALASLSVLTNLNIAGPPFSITRKAGSHAAFRIAAGGALPISYQWYVQTNTGTTFTVLTNQTADTLWLTNVQAAMSGNQYAVIASNPFNSYSNAALLTVQARTVSVPLTNGYGAVVAADSPVAYWRLDEPTNAITAVDAVGSFDGSYSNVLGPISWGIAPGIPHETNAAVDLRDPQTALIGQGGTVTVPYALELNPFGAWSVEAWVRPDSVDGQFRTPLASMSNKNFGNNVTGWNLYEYGNIPAYWTMVLYNGGSLSSFGTDLSNPVSVPGTWYYLVLTDDGTNIQFYINGAPGSANTSQTVAGTGYTPQGLNGDVSIAGAPEVIGQRTDGAFLGANAGVDDVAIYNYALSPGQIQNHFLNTTHVTAQTSGNNLVIRWSVGTLQSAPAVNGPYTTVSGATSPFTNSITGTQKFFRVQLQ